MGPVRIGVGTEWLLDGRAYRIIRQTDALPSLSEEEQYVFALRVREFVAVVRRHEAEEDLLVFLGQWRDMGGEG